MPLTPKGKKILRAMQKEYGAGKGRSVFYASINKGLIKGAEGESAPRSRRSTAKS
jgi:hypothetical protein